MVKRATKKKKASGSPSGSKRRQVRFSTSSTFMPLWVALIGFVGCLALGAGVFAMWILDPPLQQGNLILAFGGVGLGIALWFGQPNETAVFVGDAGVAVEDGRQTRRIPWFDLRAVRIEGGMVVLEGASQSLKFLVGANREATAYLLKVTAERVPDVLDVDKAIVETLPDPNEKAGQVQDVEDDQVTGARCAVSKKLISMEEDARLCPKCGQLYHKDSVPEECSHCKAALKGRALVA